MGSQASRFMAQPSFVHPLRSGKAPSFLYLKNGIFYYRYRFPGWLIAHMKHTEIRVSLRTGHRPQALRLARDLHSRLQRALDVECQHVVHPPSLEAGGFLPRAECGRKKL